jgi:hypothetical protein
MNPALANFATSFDKPNNPGVGDRNYRVIHKDDFVPDSNPLSTDVDADKMPLGYTIFTAHTSPAYNITTGNGILPSGTNLTIIDGGDKDTGASSNPIIFLPAHVFYFNMISSCT